MRSEPAKKTSHANIEQIVPCLERIVLKHLFFMHAWSGCDINSAIFNQGRTVLLTLVEKGRNNKLHIYSIFDNSLSTQDEITRAKINLFVNMNGKETNINRANYLYIEGFLSHSFIRLGGGNYSKIE